MNFGHSTPQRDQSGVSADQLPSSSTRGSVLTTSLWAFAVMGIAVVIAGAVGIGQDSSKPDRPPIDVAPSVKELSSSFRSVAKATFPGIVSIVTQGKAVQISDRGDLEDMFGGDPRLEQLFKNNPQFKRFFGQPDGSPRMQPRRRTPSGQGSGFIISEDGYIVTNNHVVSDAEVVKARLYDGREFVAEVIGVDPRSDVAVIQIDADGLQPIPLGDSKTVEVGDFVLAFGNPFGLEMTMTQGIISAKGRGPGINEREDYLQTDAAINPGNSGGPLVNLNGEVIGINTAISSRSGGYDGVGFAIPIDMAKWSADQLIESGEVKRAYIGVVIQPVTSDLADQLGVGVKEGAIVTRIMPESPAAKSGLEPGDVIRELNGDLVSGTRELQGIVERLAVGKSYPLLIQRDGKAKELTITMAQMPQQFGLAARPDDSESESQSDDENTVSADNLGLQVQALTADVAEQFGYSDDISGVIVSSVKQGSLAERSGLQAGEVIEKVNRTKISNLDDFTTAMESADPEKGVLLLVRRGEITRFLVVKGD